MIADKKVKPSSLKILSQEHFENFSTKHSWEPGWLVDLRKESWEQLKSIEENDLKNESWRFSPEVDSDIHDLIILRIHLIPQNLINHQKIQTLFVIQLITFS